MKDKKMKEQSEGSAFIFRSQIFLSFILLLVSSEDGLAI